MRYQTPVWLVLFALTSLVGCKGIVLQTSKDSSVVHTPRPVTELQASPLVPIEIQVNQAPIVNPNFPSAERLPPRGVTEETVVKAAALSSSSSGMLTAYANSADSQDGLWKELEPLLQADGRSRSASDAASLFYQLADIEGRIELLRSSLQLQERLYSSAVAAKKEGARIPVELVDLELQKAQSLALLGQAELSAKLIEGELRRRAGNPANNADRLQPTGDFSITSETVALEAAVKSALENRADLQSLRLLYHRSNHDNIDIIHSRASLVSPGLGGTSALALPASALFIRKQFKQFAATSKLKVETELQTLRKQLFVMIEEKERIVADEVRGAIAAMTEQTRQVGLARWRVETIKKRLEEARAEKRGPFLDTPLELELLKAQADVISAVMTWHQAHVRFRASMGELVK